MQEDEDAEEEIFQPGHHWVSGRNDWMQTPSFGPEDEGLLVLPSDLSEDELLEAVVENDGGVELKDEAKKAEETGEMENLEQAEQAADGEQDESNLQQAIESPQLSTKSASRSKRCIIRPPALTLAEAESAGILRPRSVRVPGCSVLTSSRLRGKRLCVHGPGVRGKRRADAELAGVPEAESPKTDGAWCWANSLLDMKLCHQPRDASSPTSPTSPATPKSRPKTAEVSSDYRLPTKSWIARIPSETSLEQKRQERNRIVVAQRITPLATVRAAFKGKSLLEERWIGNLDDSEADTEMSLPAVLAWFRRTGIYKHTLLTDAEVVDYVQQMMSGRKVAAIVSIANRRSNSISPVQFQALVHWIAQHKGISFSECIAKLVNHPGAQRTRLEHYFAEFAHGSSSGFMTVYEFTRFCKVFGLFKITRKRFVEGDVQFLFTSSGEGKAVDLEGFRRILGQVAKRIDLPLQELLHLLGEKEAAHTFHSIGK